MAIGGLSTSRNLLARKRLQKRFSARRVLLESLELRQLMAVGPQLLGIQPNSGELLANGQVLSTSPRELVFRFNDAAGIDANTLSGIRIVRSGEDGVFERASIATDFGTNGQTLVEFYAQETGEAGNGIQIQFTRVNRQDSRRPVVSVSGQLVTIQLNSNPNLETRVEDLLQVLDPNATAQSNGLIYALRLRGLQTAPIASTADVMRVFTLGGANSAKLTTSFGQSSSLQVRLTAVESGNPGLGTTVTVTGRDRGGAGSPIVTGLGKNINVEINTNSRFPTTVQEFIDAINSSSISNSVVRADLLSGLGASRLGVFPINYSPLRLSGVLDVEVVPAYVGLGDTSREVVVRFGETLPDDKYRIEILGQGSRALKNANGEAFNNGVSKSIGFELDLGAQVESVVPQPVTRNSSGQLVQQRNQIDVYFNNDDLIDVTNVVSVNGISLSTLRTLRNPLYFQNGDSITFTRPASTSVVNPNFYQLIHTGGSLTNTDDVRITPNSVRYYPDSDRVTLNFSRNLEELTNPATGAVLPTGELRLRVGTNQALPVPPLQVNPAADPGDTFSTAHNLNSVWTPGVSGSQSVVIDSTIRNTTPYTLDFPGAVDDIGNRQIRLQSLLRLAGDTVNGTSVIFYNFQGQLGTSAFNSTVQLNAITEVQKQRVREVFSIYEQYLGVRFVESTNRGLTVAVGDMRAVTPFEDILGSEITGIVELNGPGSTVYESGVLSNGQLATVLDTQDFSSSTVNGFGGPFMRGVMQGIGRLLGLGLSDEVAQLTIQSFNAIFAPGVGTEIVLPGDADIVHGQYLYRPDSKDIDLYQFRVNAPGRVTIETFAERLSEASLLDTTIRLYRQTTSGGWEEVAANDDYASSDSLVELELGAGNYIVGVSASGNGKYDPTIADSGLGGRSEGNYRLRLDYRAPASDFIRDATGTAFDGDADGIPGGSHDFWFRPSGPSNTKFVDKSVATSGTGTLAAPYKTIREAVNAAVAGDVIRIVGNGGADGLLSTPADNLAYEIGFDNLGRALPDGSTFDVPKDVTVQIDAGAILKLRRARVGVGSTSVNVDRSAGTLMVLGTPLLLDAAGNPIKDSTGAVVPGSVYFTSAGDATLGRNANSAVVGTTPALGDWGGIDIRNRVDSADATRKNFEARGQFLNSIAHADIRYGGGQVVVDGVSQVIAPIQLTDARPTIVFSQISLSADAAIAATPNSFLESNFHSPSAQLAASFTSDYSRIGPEIHGNRLTKNSVNGLQIRIRTGSEVEKMTVQGRFDDIDVVHVIPENLEIEGTAGGAIQKVAAPSSALVSLTEQVGGSLSFGTYNYRFTGIDSNGLETPASEPSASLSVFNTTGSVVLRNVPQDARRIYRSTSTTTDPFGNTIGAGPYVLIAILPAASSTFIDNGTTIGNTLSEALPSVVSRLDASLKIDAGTIVKFKGSRLDVSMGASFIAEGDKDYPVVFTSLNDARYGAGGTFDTANRSGSQNAAFGDWGGIYVGHTSKASLDHAVVAYGGGTTRIEGGFADFNAIETHQSDLRLANSRLELNGSGAVTSTDAERGGRGRNSEGVVFIRGSQPIIVNNIILNNEGAAISANVSALNASYVSDTGRSSGSLQRVDDTLGNQGPLVRGNRLDGNFYNAMVVRGGELTTEGVWDDTDMVHVVLNEVIVPDFHMYGGLRLESSPTESLVVKLKSGVNSNAGLTAKGTPLDNINRIGGSVQLVGAPGKPVIMTSLFDCTVGAGFTPTGAEQKATDRSCVAVDTREIVDVVLLLDDTGSFAGTGPRVATVFDRIISNLTTNLPDADFAFSVTRFEDYANTGGGADDRPFILNQPVITTNTPNFSAAITSALRRTSPGGGGDFPESDIEALFQIATGRGFDGNNDGDNGDSGRAGLVNTQTNPGAGGDVPPFSSFQADPTGPVLAPAGNIGGVGFRPNSTKRLVLLATDAPTSYEPDNIDPYVGKDGVRVAANLLTGGAARGTTPNGNGAEIQQTINALVANNIQVIGLADGNFGPRPFLDGIATLTGAVSSSGTPLVYNIQNTTADELANTIVTAISTSVTGATAGDWRSVLLDSYSNDRNVASVSEIESNAAISATANNSTFSAQFLGRIAPNQLAGDENQRLGFQIQGVIAKPSDVDVYSFNADAGTEVWFDIDRTDNSLDTVVELVDADGRTLALSNDSLAEEGDLSLLYRAPELGNQKVHSLRKSSRDFYPTSAAGAPKDLYSTNPRDAGFRVVLPGQVGSNNLYHVRVRSSNLGPTDAASKLLDPAHVTSGLTRGAYQLQIRLREIDEVPGSSINYADLRFAQSGVQMVGVPGNSPLLGENSEANDTRNNNRTTGGTVTAQELGNLLTTNRQAISVAGNLNNFTDVDWFSFTIDHQKITPTGLRQYFATVLDVDYGDGIGRPDVSAYVFDSAGNLILAGLGSNLVDDQANPIRGADSGDLTRGSSGGLDPYIGAYELPGGRYFVAITNSQMVPAVLATYTNANPGAATAGVRLQPIEGAAVIARDHVGGGTLGVGAPPQVVFPTAGTFDSSTGTFYTAANDSVVDFGLADIGLFVSQDVGTELTNVYVVNPFTGERRAQLGRVPRDLADIAFRDNGTLQAFDRALERRNAANNQDTEVEYMSIDTGTGATNIIGTTGMVTNHLEFNNGTPAVVASNDGFNPEAITFAVIGGDERGFMVANRPTPPGFEQSYTVIPGNDLFDWETFGRQNPGQSRPGPSYFTNVLYEFNENTGVPTSDPLPDKQNLAVASGAGTAIRERGYIETLPAAGALSTLLVAKEVTTSRPGSTPLFVLQDGDTFILRDSSGFAIGFEFDLGPEVLVNYNPANGLFVRDGMTFTLDGTTYEFDTGSVIVVNATSGAGVADGSTVRVTNQAGVERIFEYDLNGQVIGGSNVPVRISATSTPAQIAQALANAINNTSGFGVTAAVNANSNRVSLINASTTQAATVTGSGITVSGTPGVTLGNVQIPIEETSSLKSFLSAIDKALPDTVTLSYEGGRMNFSGATTGSFTSLVNAGLFTDLGSSGGTVGGNIGVKVLASDTAETVAARIAAAVNTSGIPGLSASFNGAEITLSGGSIANAGNLIAAGLAPGGIVRGIAVINGTMYAVSDKGGLFRVFSPTAISFGNVGDYIESSYDLLGIPFTGLVAGPTHLSGTTPDGTPYSQLLFGIDVDGNIHAFNTAGRLQPVFANGATSVATGLSSATGLAMSTLDFNLWHVSNSEPVNGGASQHGIPPTTNDTRIRQNGGSSLYFGYENPGANGGTVATGLGDLNGNGAPSANNNYNFPGGAAGAIESASFSLNGLGAADLPMLYFNYYFETEQAGSSFPRPTDAADYMRDSLRVYVSGDDGVWVKVATNNSDRSTNLDEFDPQFGNFQNQVQELFDNNGQWRQARIPLDAFAGQSNVKIRIEFSSAGGFGYGFEGGRGPEIRTIPGRELADGATLTVHGETFEIEMGVSVTLPGGTNLQNGDSISIDGRRFVFYNGVGPAPSGSDIAVNFTSSMTAEQVTTALLNAINGSAPNRPIVSGLSFTTEANDVISNAAETGIDGETVRVIGSGVIGDNPAYVDTGRDVDMIRLDLEAGAIVTAAIEAASIGSALDSFLRVFDGEGRILRNAFGQPIQNDNRAGSLDSLVSFVAPEAGTYYIGVSGAGNQQYNPAVAITATSGSTGAYNLIIDVTRQLSPVRDGNRLQLVGAKSVSTSTTSLLVQGSFGSTGTPVFVDVSMDRAEVAQALQTSLANFFANGSTNVYAIRGGDTLDLTGLVEYDSFDFFTGLPAPSPTELDPGPFGANVSFEGDLYSAFNAGTNFDGTTNTANPGFLAGQNNGFRGVHLDDFIIGIAGRGEMVLDAQGGNDQFVVDPQLSLSNPVRPNTEILQGPYQFELRGGDGYGIPLIDVPPVRLLVTDNFAPDERLAPGISVTFNSAARMIAGQTFTLSDGTTELTFEMDDVNDGINVQAGNIAIPFNTAAFDPTTGARRSETAQEIAGRVRDIVNSPQVQSLFKLTANLLNNDRTGATSSTVVFDSTATVNVPSTIGTTVVTKGIGTQNRDRQQGQVVVNNTRVSNSLNFGITIDPAPRDPVTGAPLPGSPRNTITVNTERLAPGAVVMNSEFLFNQLGGISVEGDAQTNNVPAAAVPFVRLVNNTIIGGSLSTPTRFTPRVFGEQFFAIGDLAFADTLVSYRPSLAGGTNPIAGLNFGADATGVPNFSGTGEPKAGENVVSLGRGGQLVVQFTDNLLAGSGDANPDLVIFEVGDSEEVLVEVSADGARFTEVGRASAASPTIDIDAAGFNTSSRLAYVRITDIANQGSQTGDSVGADIDAVGAITSVASDNYLPGGVGISVTNNATATLLNNVIVNSTSGVLVDQSSSSTVIGGTVFQYNSNNVSGVATLGQFPTVVANNVPMFVAVNKGILYPAPSSPVIDSSIDSLQDRPSLVAVKQPLGMASSPIVAPQYDSNGQLRVDDPSVETPSGLGSNIFKDRGAQDRADFVGPSVLLVQPIDNDVQGLDTNPEPSVVELTGTTLPYFDIQLFDGIQPSDPGIGSRVNPDTVQSSSILLYRDGVPLVEGSDYSFGYNATSGIIRLQPLAGIWPSDSAYTIRFVNTNESSITAQNGANYTDALSFDIIDDAGSTTTFEFDTGYIVTIPTTNFGLDANVVDGSTFIVDDGTRRFTFEFDSNSSITAGNIAIPIGTAPTPTSVAAAVVTALTGTSLRATVRDLLNGKIQIQGTDSLVLTPNNSGLTLAGQPGVRSAFGIQIPLAAGLPVGVLDGQTFSINRSGTPVVFEIDSDGSIATGNIAVRISTNANATQIGNAIVTAINGASLGLSPTYVGNGFVRLGGDKNTRLDLTGSVLQQRGVPGLSAAVSIPISAAAINGSVAIAALIKSTIDAQGLTGVTTTQFGSRVVIEGARGVAGSGVGQIGGIQDSAGNVLKANQPDGTTVLTIFLGEGLDYGDAPATKYTTSKANNGPRHVVVNGLSLGATVSTDADAKLPNLDNDDGVTFGAFTAAFGSNFTVNVTNTTGAQAYLSYWIDYNNDGVFGATEGVVQSAISAGNTTFTVVVPSGAVKGQTYARFRVSTDRASVASPVGSAPDGEVEDHLITINPNPYKNPSSLASVIDANGNNLDVNADGFVTPIDVLQVISYLNSSKPKDLTLPLANPVPPYIDVNGDAAVSALDALLVVNFLSRIRAGSASGSGEGEGALVGEGEGSVDSMASAAFTQQDTLASNWVAGLENVLMGSRDGQDTERTYSEAAMSAPSTADSALLAAMSDEDDVIDTVSGSEMVWSEVDSVFGSEGGACDAADLTLGLDLKRSKALRR